MGDSPKWVKSRRRRKRERERERGVKVGDNNGQATHGARKHAWRTQAAWANFRSFALNYSGNVGKNFREHCTKKNKALKTIKQIEVQKVS